MTSKLERIVLIDGNNLIYRAFYGLPPLETARGEKVQALYGFITMLMKILEDTKPDYVVASFDRSAPHERLKEYGDYKVHRQKMPEDLQSQLPLVEEALALFNIPVVWLEGHEADDCIGTLAKKASEEGIESILVSGDGDFLQLVAPLVKVLSPKRQISSMVLYDEQKVCEGGIAPSQVVDYKALAGDASDNIPGVAGIGDVTARRLIARFGSLEGLLGRLDEVTPRQKALIEASLDNARLSQRLAAIRTDLPLSFDHERFRKKGPHKEELKSFLTRMEFHSLIGKILGEEDAVRPSSAPAAEFTIVHDLKEFHALLEVLEHSDAVSLFWMGEGALRSPHQVTALALAAAPACWYIPFARGGQSLFEWNEEREALDSMECLDALSRTLARGPLVIGHDIKEWLRLLGGLPAPRAFFDTAGAAHLLDPREASPKLSAVAARYLGHGAKGREEMQQEYRKGTLPEESIPGQAAASASAILALHGLLSGELDRHELADVYRRQEIPLLPVLADMERKGIFVDTKALFSAKERLAKRALELEEQIFLAAGEKFNVNSPKQLGEILFGKLGLPAKEKTTQGFSTSHDVLQGLAAGYPIVGLVLEYKELKKLQSTYAEALPGMVDQRTGRIHSTFNPRGTATGRLSSSEPNLQNIPIRSAMGHLIRRAFRPEHQGFLFVGADYSQIELRVLAHLSQDQRLSEAFRLDQDIHTMTASEIFSVPCEEVDESMRRKAKEINFGIVYGMSAHGLSERIRVGRKEAQDYIDRYLSKFSGVRRFIDETIESAAEKGYVTTLFGRKRWLPDIKSRNVGLRKATERMAINTPVQGSAADLIKKAMIDLHDALRTAAFSADLVVQVHDELILEVKEEDSGALGALMISTMEHVHPLAVPLKVHLEKGKNWSDMEEFIPEEVRPGI